MEKLSRFTTSTSHHCVAFVATCCPWLTCSLGMESFLKGYCNNEVWDVVKSFVHVLVIKYRFVFPLTWMFFTYKGAFATFFHKTIWHIIKIFVKLFQKVMFVTFFIVKSLNEVWLSIFIWYFKKEIKASEGHSTCLYTFCWCEWFLLLWSCATLQQFSQGIICKCESTNILIAMWSSFLHLRNVRTSTWS